MTIIFREFSNYRAFLTAVKEGKKYGKITKWVCDNDKSDYKGTNFTHSYHVCEIEGKNSFRRLSCDVMEMR